MPRRSRPAITKVYHIYYYYYHYYYYYYYLPGRRSQPAITKVYHIYYYYHHYYYYSTTTLGSTQDSVFGDPKVINTLKKVRNHDVG